MIRFCLALLLAVCSCSAFPPWVGFRQVNQAPPVTPYTAQLLIDFESGINGATIDATYMNANDHGTPDNPWITGGATLPTVTTAQFRSLITPVIVNSVTYDDATGTRGASFTHATDGYAQHQLTGGPYNQSVTAACWWKSTMPEPDTLFGTYDVLSLQNSGGGGSEWAVAQIQNWGMHAHASGTGAGGVGKGLDINLHRDTWYWIVVKYARADGCYLNIYDTTGALVGTSYCPFGASTEGVRFIQFGNIAPHAAFPTGNLFYDNIVFLIGSNPTFPVGP